MHGFFRLILFFILVTKAITLIGRTDSAVFDERYSRAVEAAQSPNVIGSENLIFLDSLEYLALSSPGSAKLGNGFKVGSLFLSLHRYDRAANLYDKLSALAKANNDTSNLARSLFYEGLSYARLGVQNKAMECFFQSLALAQSQGDSARSAQAYVQIGLIKKDQESIKEAIAYFEKALKLALEAGDQAMVASIYNNIGSAHKKVTDYPRAKEFFLLAMEINKQISNERNLSYNYNNLANIYEETGDLETALTYHQKSVEIKERINDRPSLAISFCNISLVYMKINQNQKALEYVQKSIKLALEYKVASILPIAYGQYALILSRNGDFKQAFDVMQKLNQFKDSLAQVDRQAIINEMEVKYERQLILNENELLKKDIQISETQLYRKDAFLIVLGVCVIMLLVVVVMYYQSFKRRSEANTTLQEQNSAILAQKNRIEKQKKRIEESTANLEKIRKDKEVFFSTISHDMRGPINAISAIVSIIKRDNPNIDEELQVLDYSAQALNALVEDIMDFSNLESGRLQIEQKTFSILETLKGVAKSFEFISNEKEVDLIVDLEKYDQSLLGDPKRIRQVLFNLLGNAFKFTKDGFVKLSLRVIQVDSLNHVLKITVEDSGIGISEANLDVVFNKFEQASPEIYKSFGGNGLGLFISKTLIDQMGGTIDVESKMGEGTKFMLSIPLPVVRQTQA